MSTELPPLAFFAEIYRRHGHRCPMSTLGGRLGFAARRHFADERPEFAAVYRIATCAVDGIRHALGCEAALEVRDQGEHRLTLSDSNSGAYVEVALRAEALSLAGAYRRQGEELDATRLDALLERLRTLPDAELLIVQSGTAHE